MNQREKAEEIVRQGGECNGFICDSGGENKCPCWGVCTSSKSCNENRVAACREFLGEQIIDDAVVGTPRTNAPTKTLLDEFAMAAIEGMLASPQDLDFVWRDEWTFSEFLVKSSFEIASAMLAEKLRRDEMGNVKEVK